LVIIPDIQIRICLRKFFQEISLRLIYLYLF